MKITSVTLAAAVIAVSLGTYVQAADPHAHGTPAAAPAAATAAAPAASTPPAPTAPKPARARLEPRSDSQVTGTASFTTKDGKVTLDLKVEGLTPGEHAVHIHEKGDCSAPDAASAGGHWNPMAKEHGMFGHDPYHHGDIGNLVAGADGKAQLTFSTDQWMIGGAGKTDILGHALIVHATVDDFKTQPTGNAGGRVACGVIRPGSLPPQ